MATEKDIQEFFLNELNAQRLRIESLESRLSHLESLTKPKQFETQAHTQKKLLEILKISKSTFQRRLKTGEIIRVKRGLFRVLSTHEAILTRMRESGEVMDLEMISGLIFKLKSKSDKG